MRKEAAPQPPHERNNCKARVNAYQELLLESGKQIRRRSAPTASSRLIKVQGTPMNSSSSDPPRWVLLTVDADSEVRARVVALASKEFEVLTASSAESAQAFFFSRSIDAILTGLQFAGATGSQLLG